jgi:hypothetical protein
MAGNSPNKANLSGKINAISRWDALPHAAAAPARVLAARPRVAHVEVFGVDEDRRAPAGIDGERAIVLRQIMRLETAGLVPHHRQHIAEAPLRYEIERCRKIFFRRPTEQVSRCHLLTLGAGVSGGPSIRISLI